MTGNKPRTDYNALVERVKGLAPRQSLRVPRVSNTTHLRRSLVAAGLVDRVDFTLRQYADVCVIRRLGQIEER